MSITGALGGDARDFSYYLLMHNLVHAISSNAHSADFRGSVLSAAYGIAADIVGRKKAEDLVFTIPQAIIEGRGIPALGPVGHRYPENAQRGKWFTRLFRAGKRETLIVNSEK